MSGIESCTAPVRYTGPDRVNGAIAGTCRDAAGNVAERMHVFRYDATAPALTKAAAELVRGDARITWRRSADAVTVQIVRTPGRNGAKSTVVYRGAGTSFVDETVRDGVRYRYGLRAEDAAGNIAERGRGRNRTATALPAGARFGRAGAGAARLGGTEGRHASTTSSFCRDGVKVLSTWPRAATLRLGSTWRYDGQALPPRPGHLQLVVWAAAARENGRATGDPLGSSTFTVKR